MFTLERVGYNKTEIEVGMNHCRQNITERLSNMFIQHITMVYKVKRNDKIERVALWVSKNIQKMAFINSYIGTESVNDNYSTDKLLVIEVIRDLLKSQNIKLNNNHYKHLVNFIDELKFEALFLSRQLIEEEFPEYKIFLSKKGQAFSNVLNILTNISNKV
jgi:hypothetical protein